MSPIIAGSLESYERAYSSIIALHQAVELQEVITYKSGGSVDEDNDGNIN